MAVSAALPKRMNHLGAVLRLPPKFPSLRRRTAPAAKRRGSRVSPVGYLARLLLGVRLHVTSPPRYRRLFAPLNRPGGVTSHHLRQSIRAQSD